jgi:hypothetical protein
MLMRTPEAKEIVLADVLTGPDELLSVEANSRIDLLSLPDEMIALH